MSGKLVCAAVAEDSHKAWMQAAKEGDQASLKAMIDNKIDINYIAAPGTSGMPMDLQGKSAVSLCAKLGHCDCLQLLLKSGASRKVLISKLLRAILTVEYCAENRA